MRAKMVSVWAACIFMAAHSSASSLPGLSKMALLTPSLPMSCSSAARLSQRRRSGERFSSSAIMSANSVTRSLCPLVKGLFESTTWANAAAMSSR